MSVLQTYWEMAQLAQASYIDLASRLDRLVRGNDGVRLGILHKDVH